MPFFHSERHFPQGSVRFISFPVSPKGDVGKKTNTLPCSCVRNSPVLLAHGRRVSLFQTSSLWTVFCPTDKYKRNTLQKSSPKAHALILNLVANFVIFEQFFHKFPRESMPQKKKPSPPPTKRVCIFILLAQELSHPASYARTAKLFPIRRITGTGIEPPTVMLPRK